MRVQGRFSEVTKWGSPRFRLEADAKLFEPVSIVVPFVGFASFLVRILERSPYGTLNGLKGIPLRDPEKGLQWRLDLGNITPHVP